MHINTKLLESRGYNIDIFPVLQLIHQNKYNDESKYLETLLSEDMRDLLTKNELVKFVKAKKKADPLSKLIRLNKKGETLLSDLQTPDVLEEDLILFDWLKSVYKEKEKALGNQKRTKQYIAFFRTHSGIEKKNLAFLVASFVNDENNMEYSHMLEYVFFKGANVFQTKFELGQSRLWRYYEQNKEYFDKQFEKMNDNK